MFLLQFTQALLIVSRALLGIALCVCQCLFEVSDPLSRRIAICLSLASAHFQRARAVRRLFSRGSQGAFQFMNALGGFLMERHELIHPLLRRFGLRRCARARGIHRGLLFLQLPRRALDQFVRRVERVLQLLRLLRRCALSLAVSGLFLGQLAPRRVELTLRLFRISSKAVECRSELMGLLVGRRFEIGKSLLRGLQFSAHLAGLRLHFLQGSAERGDLRFQLRLPRAGLALGFGALRAFRIPLAMSGIQRGGEFLNARLQLRDALRAIALRLTQILDIRLNLLLLGAQSLFRLGQRRLFRSQVFFERGQSRSRPLPFFL